MTLTGNIALFFALTLVITYCIAPMMRERQTETWAYVMILRLRKIKGMRLSLFCIIGTIVCVIFTSLGEDGSWISPFINIISNLFTLFRARLLLLVAFDVLIGPMIYRSQTT